jgi:hypothetical protein
MSTKEALVKLGLAILSITVFAILEGPLSVFTGTRVNYDFLSGYAAAAIILWKDVDRVNDADVQ